MYFPSACATRIRSDHFRYKWRELSRLRLISCNSWERQEWDGSAQQLTCLWKYCWWLGWESIHFFLGEASCSASGLWDLAMGEMVWHMKWYEIWHDMNWITVWNDMNWNMHLKWYEMILWQDGMKWTTKWLYEMTLWNDCMTVWRDCMKWLYEMRLFIESWRTVCKSFGSCRWLNRSESRYLWYLLILFALVFAKSKQHCRPVPVFCKQGLKNAQYCQWRCFA